MTIKDFSRKSLKTKLLIILFFLSLFVTSCSKDSENIGDGSLDPKVANTDINILEIPGQDKVKSNNAPISLQLINLSNSNIILNNDYDLKLLVYEKNKWKEISNCFQYAGSRIALPAVDGPQLGEVFVIIPCMDQINEALLFRVWVSGMKQDQTKEKVIAYIDLQLQP